MPTEDTQSLVTEIEILKVVFCIWRAEIIEEEAIYKRVQQKTRIGENFQQSISLYTHVHFTFE
jgi:hypothetical protein